MNHQLQTTWQHIRRSPYQAAAAVMIMILTFVTAATFSILSVSFDRMLTYLERKPQVIAFFNDTITSESQVQDIEDQLKTTGKLAGLNFVSKEQALNIYRERNKSDPLLLELVSSNTLPTSLEVSAKSVSDLPALYDLLKSEKNVEEISYQQDVVNSLIGVVDKIRKFGVVLIGFLLLVAIFVVVTVVGMKISLRKSEVEVERLIGASKWYIRWPFILEGVIYGAAGALFAWATVITMMTLASSSLVSFLGTDIAALLPIVLITSGDWAKIAINYGLFLFILASSGIVIGSIGSFLALWRYLRD